MNNFEYYNPVRVIFGAGELSRVGEEAAKLGKRVCMVSYKELFSLEPVMERIAKILEDAGENVFRFFEVEANPEVRMVERGAAFCKENDIEVVIGIGGGSAMDAAKAISAGVFYEGDLWKMVVSSHSRMDAVPPVKSLPMIQIPTLPATGSEMNQCAVLSNAALKEKSYLWSECLYAKTAIIDPELTLTLPPFQTACAAADSISHVLEIYINGEEDSDVQHYFQEGVIRTIIDNIGKVLEKPDDISARSHLQWAATCAINGWASPGDAWTPIHQVGHVLTSRHKVPHGASLSILMPAWMKYMWKRRPERYLRFAHNVMGIPFDGRSDEKAITDGIATFRQLLADIKVPLTLKEYGITREDIPAIVEGCVKVSFGSDGMLQCQPQKVSREDIKKVLELCYE